MRRIGIALLVASVFAVGLRWASFVAGGSDSYCYLHQAQRWASGRLQVSEPLALEAPWPNAPLTFAPAGHVPSSTVPGAIVPICPSGLSMVMAMFVAFGGIGAAALVVPLFGALLIWGTFLAGSRFGARVGVASAGLAACSPVFLYQLVQPMSDVPAAACWMLAVAAVTGTRRNGSALGGLAAAMAILIRPNLVPLAAPLGVFLLWRPERRWRQRLQSTTAFGLCIVAACLAVAAIQRTYYGSALNSGYGTLAAIYSLDRVAPNAQRYFSWMSDLHTPVWMMAAATPLLLPGALTRLLVGLVLVNVACYLPYVVFDHWSYLRFLLPTLPLLVIMVVAGVDAICRRAAPVAAMPALIILTLLLAVLWVREAQDRQAFRLQALEARFERGGTFVDRRLPPDALVITSWHSGSVRFYSGRKTLVWDQLDPAALDQAIAFVRSRGFEPYLLFERWEEPLFRRRFAAQSAVGRLDWPPAAEVASQVRVYRPDDRDRYLRGVQPPTEYVR
jgi:Dolichyl-phosphate-mannose-protein mannosyltransferase